MVSIVVVGPSMSGKTTVCSMLAGMYMEDPHGFNVTCSCSYLTVVSSGTEWHVWDTPGLESPADIERGWAGEDVLAEADVVVVCHDGRHTSPMHLVDACGRDRCVIALTRGPAAAVDIAYALDYLRSPCSNGSLVPRASGSAQLLMCIKQLSM